MRETPHPRVFCEQSDAMLCFRLYCVNKGTRNDTHVILLADNTCTTSFQKLNEKDKTKQTLDEASLRENSVFLLLSQSYSTCMWRTFLELLFLFTSRLIFVPYHNKLILKTCAVPICLLTKSFSFFLSFLLHVFPSVVLESSTN